MVAKKKQKPAKAGPSSTEPGPKKHRTQSVPAIRKKK